MSSNNLKPVLSPSTPLRINSVEVSEIENRNARADRVIK